MLIGGLMIPSSILPDALAKVGLLLPATHAMNAFQGLAQNQAATFDPLWSVLILLAGGILSFGLANFLFSWDSRNPTRRGHPALALLALLPYVIGVILL
jgi:ABC-2 type transport system permease protein